MIRKATLEDAARIAEIEVTSSRFAYKDLVAEEILFHDTLVENRIPRYKEWISNNVFDLYVYEDPSTKVIKGMMGFGKCGDEDKPNAFELHFIYNDPNFLRTGIGTEMIKFFEKTGKENGFSEFVIWVLEENEIGKNCYLKNGYSSDGSEKIFQRYQKKEIRFVKQG